MKELTDGPLIRAFLLVQSLDCFKDRRLTYSGTWELQGHDIRFEAQAYRIFINGMTRGR